MYPTGNDHIWVSWKNHRLKSTGESRGYGLVFLEGINKSHMSLLAFALHTLPLNSASTFPRLLEGNSLACFNHAGAEVWATVDPRNACTKLIFL